MIRMLVDGEAETSFQYSLAEKFAVMMEDFKLTKDKLVHEFGAVRDAWIQSDLDSWLAPQNPYPNTIESLKSALQKHRVLILTTKQERFVKAWLGHFNVDFPQEDIIGLDRKTPKEETLAELVRANKKNIHFVEDRLKTLQRVAAIPSLKRVNLHYADWGYGTPAELREAKSLTRIDTITLSDFYDLLS
jgi:phosphoglycolate phosphatase-like HAD superfamily hydrolase